MAHLAHKIPWHTLASKLEFIRDRKGLTPRTTDLFCRNGQENTIVLKYFVAVLSRTIAEFALTEREKYPKKSSCKRDGFVFSPAIIQDALPWLNRYDASSLSRYGFADMDIRQCNKLEDWITQVGSDPRPAQNHAYNDDVGLLLGEDQTAALLTLSSHPEVRLDLLDRTSHNYQFGWTETMRLAFMSYLCFNLMFCKPELWENGETAYLEVKSFRAVMGHLTSTLAGDMIYIHSRKFVGKPDHNADLETRIRSFNPFQDISELQKYLKSCFNLLVRFQLMELEASRTPDWAEIYAFTFAPCYMHRSSMFHFDNSFDYSGGLFSAGSHWLQTQ